MIYTDINFVTSGIVKLNNTSINNKCVDCVHCISRNYKEQIGYCNQYRYSNIKIGEVSFDFGCIKFQKKEEI